MLMILKDQTTPKSKFIQSPLGQNIPNQFSEFRREHSNHVTRPPHLLQ